MSGIWKHTCHQAAVFEGKVTPRKSARRRRRLEEMRKYLIGIYDIGGTGRFGFLP